MQVYLVGGAVRDRLLGLPVHDRDWVVVGSTVAQMQDAGYKTVGRDFPVFLHPESHEEYALARTERKTAPGYRGFSIHAEPDVTLEQDLQRRDITINAIAEDSDGKLVDPFNGVQDLQQRVLRHVSEAFAEDPVRILRVARFAARLQPHGFSVAEETFELMRQMADSGEVDALVPERVWQELRTALLAGKPSVFFDVLSRAGALSVVLPEVNALFGIAEATITEPGAPKPSPTAVNSGVHTMQVLDAASALAATHALESSDESDTEADNQRARICFAALCQDLGKTRTPQEQWSSHPAHEENGVPVSENLSQRLRVPNDYRQLALACCRYHTDCHRALQADAESLVQTLAALDAIRRPERTAEFLLVCEADARGTEGERYQAYPQSDTFKAALLAMQSVDAGAIAQSTMKSVQANKQEFSNPSMQIKKAVHAARIAAVSHMLRPPAPAAH